MKKIFTILIAVSTLALSDFTRNGDIVTDNSTKLQWDDSAINGAIGGGTVGNWETAISYCEDLTLEGYSDWRLPNIREFKSIIDRSRANRTLYDAFQNITNANHWTSTTSVSNSTQAWTVSVTGGNDATYDKTVDFYARCVR